MFKIISIIVYFIRELIFDNKEEYNIKSSKFNTRKFIIFTIIMLSMIVNIFAIDKTYTLAKKNLEFQKKLLELNGCKK